MDMNRKQWFVSLKISGYMRGLMVVFTLQCRQENLEEIQSVHKKMVKGWRFIDNQKAWNTVKLVDSIFYLLIHSPLQFPSRSGPLFKRQQYSQNNGDFGKNATEDSFSTVSPKIAIQTTTSLTVKRESDSPITILVHQMIERDLL